jgi:hypothetical protein
MTDKEKELFKIINEDENPALALKIAIGIIISFLELHESFEELNPVVPLESV